MSYGLLEYIAREEFMRTGSTESIVWSAVSRVNRGYRYQPNSDDRDLLTKISSMKLSAENARLYCQIYAEFENYGDLTHGEIRALNMMIPVKRKARTKKVRTQQNHVSYLPIYKPVKPAYLGFVYKGPLV